MNFGFDIDGTIGAAPEAYTAMIAALLSAGHECHVITGTMDPEVTPDHMSKRALQLQRYGLEWWTKLHIVTAPHALNKAKYCQENNIVFMFEDSPAYADEIRKVTTCVLMCP